MVTLSILNLGFDVLTRTSSHELLASFKKSFLGKGPSNHVFFLHYPDEHFKVDPPPLDNVDWLSGYSWSLPSLFGLFFIEGKDFMGFLRSSQYEDYIEIS